MLQSFASSVFARLHHGRNTAMGIRPPMSGTSGTSGTSGSYDRSPQPTTIPTEVYKFAVDRGAYTCVPGTNSEIPEIREYHNWPMSPMTTPLMYQSIAPSDEVVNEAKLSEEDMLMRQKRIKAHLNAFHRCLIQTPLWQ